MECGEHVGIYSCWPGKEECSGGVHRRKAGLTDEGLGRYETESITREIYISSESGEWMQPSTVYGKYQSRQKRKSLGLSLNDGGCKG